MQNAAALAAWLILNRNSPASVNKPCNNALRLDYDCTLDRRDKLFRYWTNFKFLLGPGKFSVSFCEFTLKC